MNNLQVGCWCIGQKDNQLRKTTTKRAEEVSVLDDLNSVETIYSEDPFSSKLLLNPQSPTHLSLFTTTPHIMARTPSLSTSPRRKYRTPERRNKNGFHKSGSSSNSNSMNMLHSVVQGVSQLTMCSNPSLSSPTRYQSMCDPTTTASIMMEGVFGKPFWDHSQDEEATQTTTASTHQGTTASRSTNDDSFMSSRTSSPLIPPSRICQHRHNMEPSREVSLPEFLSQSNRRQALHLPQPQPPSFSTHHQNTRDMQAKQTRLPPTAEDLDELDYHYNNNDNTRQAVRENNSKSKNLPATAIDLDNDDVLSYGSAELAACWDDVDDDDLHEDTGVVDQRSNYYDDANQPISHQTMQDYQDRHQRMEKGVDDEPPLSTQTLYARQQLLHSSRYLAMKQEQQQQQYEEQDDLIIDEMEISQGLMGYEEGFAVPKVHEFHVLPFQIHEEPEEEEESSSSSSSSSASFSVSLIDKERRSVGTTQLETLTYDPYYGNDLRDDAGADRNFKKRTSKTGSGSLGIKSAHDSVCFHCSRGTCENHDCSGSRFMI